MAPRFPQTIMGVVGKAVYEIDFPFLDDRDIRVVRNELGSMLTLGTHYTIQKSATDGGKATITFLPAASMAVIPFYLYRNTPLALRKPTLEVGHLSALQALYRQQEQGERPITLKKYINATSLAAGAQTYLVAPSDGYITKLRTQVVDAAIGTGGDVTVWCSGAEVEGLSISVANSAAIGTIQEDTPTTPYSETTKVRAGEPIGITPSAAFATSGALIVEIEFQPADLD